MATLNQFRLKQPEWLKSWLMPRSSKPVERFVETVLRSYLPFGVVLSLLAIPGTLLYEQNSLQDFSQKLYAERHWLALSTNMLVLHLLGVLALRRNNLRAAVRWMMTIYSAATFGLLLITLPSDPTLVKIFILFLVVSMSVPNGKLIIAMTVGTVALIAIAVFIRGTNASPDPRISTLGAFLSQAEPIILEGFILLLVRHEIDTHLLDLDRARLEAESASRTKSEFLRTISHELRNPLAIIELSTDALAQGRYVGGKPALPEYLPLLGKIKRADEELLTMLDDLFEYIGLERGTPQANQVKHSDLSFIRTVVLDMQTIAEAKHLSLTLNFDSSAPTQIECDERQLQHVLKNLLSNAIKFTERGEIEVSVSATQDKWNIAVADNGIGIGSEYLQRIFELFYQVDSGDARSHNGLGLGLSIVKSTVKKLGGTITVQSELGRGSTFTVTLPKHVETVNNVS